VNLNAGPIWLNVACDYYQENGEYVALSAAAVGKICRVNNTHPATRKLVDIIFQQANTRLVPTPINVLHKVAEHNAIVKAQLAAIPLPHGLICGSKKDIVLSNLITSKNVVFYGMHFPSGKVVQPFNAVSHDRNYQDYSMNFREIDDEILVNGEPDSYRRVLADPNLYHFISDELILPTVSY
jgi:hypothetical protein